MYANLCQTYFKRYENMECPQWVAAERYDFCESFHGIFSLLTRKG